MERESYTSPLKPTTPPRHTMREVIDFIEWSIRHADPEQVRRQKEWEEQIEKRFHFPEEERKERAEG